MNHRQFDDSMNAVLLPEDQMTSTPSPTTTIEPLTTPPPPTTTARPEKLKPFSVRHFDHSKIQSDTKDIALDDNILVTSFRRSKVTASAHHPTVLTTTAPAPSVTHVAQLDVSDIGMVNHWHDAQTLTDHTTIRKRHRRRRQGRYTGNIKIQA